jgi:hypothetical protein
MPVVASFNFEELSFITTGAEEEVTSGTSLVRIGDYD